MSSDCESYYSKENVLVDSFTCPKTASDTSALFCCGFSDLKYCCDDPDSFFPYEYGFMWWLSFGAFVGLSVAAVVLLAFVITLCVLCYLFITTKPRGLDNGLPLRVPGSTYLPQGTRAGHSKLDHDNQQPDPDRHFQRCFVATVTSIKVESPA
ncbi:protein shisa-like-2A [Odontesthes bonariensis]|uniref:protein shisa-like-2A n=1 Tax=Odontesthes bonariensis TaxID=219752 RepID=UPI003F58A0F4